MSGTNEKRRGGKAKRAHRFSCSRKIDSHGVTRSTNGPLRHIGRPQPRLEPAVFVEAMHARVGAAALQKYVMAILLPRCRQRGAPHGAGQAAAAMFGMSDNVFQERVPAPGAQ